MLGSDQSANLAEYGCIVEVHFLADQIATVEDEYADAVHVHLFSRRLDPRPFAALRAAELDFHDDSAVCVVYGPLLEPQIGKGRQELLNKVVNTVRTIDDHSGSWDFVARLREGCYRCSDVVVHCFSLEVCFHYSFSPRSQI